MLLPYLRDETAEMERRGHSRTEQVVDFFTVGATSPVASLLTRVSSGPVGAACNQGSPPVTGKRTYRQLKTISLKTDN